MLVVRSTWGEGGMGAEMASGIAGVGVVVEEEWRKTCCVGVF